MKEYKCPCCGGAISFDSALQKMKCPYCDTTFEVETLNDYQAAVNEDQSDDLHWDEPTESFSEDESSGLCTYICQSCGGEIMGDENTAATLCPYCGNPVVMTGRVSGDLRPHWVVPFKLDRAAAKKALLEHYKGKRLLPKVFRDDNHLDEIRGIYVPFWLYDADATASMRYKAARIRVWSDARFDYTETSHFALLRTGHIAFANVPADGSSKMPDELMESIEPFDLSEAVDFQTAYLAGYLADKYDVSAEACSERANDRIRETTEEAFASTTAGYTSVTAEHKSVRLCNARAKYALLPVWILNTTWNGQKYTFAMNGQTGKFVGNLPSDKSTFTRWFLGLTGAVGAAVFGLSFLLGL